MDKDKNSIRAGFYKAKFLTMFSHDELAEMIAITMIEGGLSDEMMQELLIDWIQIQTFKKRELQN